jgi:hypothetical protein
MTFVRWLDRYRTRLAVAGGCAVALVLALVLAGFPRNYDQLKVFEVMFGGVVGLAVVVLFVAFTMIVAIAEDRAAPRKAEAELPAARVVAEHGRPEPPVAPVPVASASAPIAPPKLEPPSEQPRHLR